MLRRVSANVLLLVLSLTLMNPLLAALLNADASNLPACCRRDGKHHCGTRGESSTAAIAPAPCAEYPQLAPATTVDTVVGNPPSWSAHSFAVLSAPSIPYGQSDYRITYSHSAQKRGPPSIRL